jgi:hypothetical protein
MRPVRIARKLLHPVPWDRALQSGENTLAKQHRIDGVSVHQEILRAITIAFNSLLIGGFWWQGNEMEG